jgi:hypothetical protein
MGVVEQSHETVESYLSALDESYGSFPVNQSTVSVPSAEYERERERASAGYVDLYTKVTNEDADVLHVEDDDELVVPSTRTNEHSLEDVATACVEKQTGLSCAIEMVEQATILGVQNSDSDCETVYRLAVVFEATPTAPPTEPSSVETEAVWHSTAKVPEIVAP